MPFYRKQRSSYRTSNPRRSRGLTQAQAEAIRKAFDAAPATVEGRFAKGAFITDGGKLWKVVSGGIRYHEDVSTALYGVAPVVRPPKEWKATCTLQDMLATILRDGTQTPDSRAAKRLGDDQNVPVVAKIASWEDSKPGSLASFPYLTIHEDGVIVAVRPIYDDSPIVAWIRNPKLAKTALDAIAIAPKPFAVASATVKIRAPKQPQPEPAGAAQ
jgi:hypothetical protein